MTAYLVRMAADFQVVGIFTADDIEQLAYLVDQACPPSETEYLELPPGGFYVGSQTTAQWPPRLLDDAEFHPEDANPLRGGALDEAWFAAVMDGKWRHVRPPTG